VPNEPGTVRDITVAPPASIAAIFVSVPAVGGDEVERAVEVGETRAALNGHRPGKSGRGGWDDRERSDDHEQQTEPANHRSSFDADGGPTPPTP